MNVDYEIRDLDNRKMKIDKMLEELEKLATDPKVEVRPVLEIKNWEESFKKLVQACRNVDIKKRSEIRENLARFYNSNNSKTL